MLGQICVVRTRSMKEAWSNIHHIRRWSDTINWALFHIEVVGGVLLLGHVTEWRGVMGVRRSCF